MEIFKGRVFDCPTVALNSSEASHIGQYFLYFVVKTERNVEHFKSSDFLMISSSKSRHYLIGYCDYTASLISYMKNSFFGLTVRMWNAFPRELLTSTCNINRL